MISAPTVIILGAGASMPYGFPSGMDLRDTGRHLDRQEFLNQIPLELRGEGPALHQALLGTLSRSIDAMLETRPKLVDAGKAFMARSLLQCERNWRDNSRQTEARRPGQQWHEYIWAACDQSSLERFEATPLTLITYNYDRSVEFALTRSLQETFEAPVEECAEALDCIGPIHLHGQLGSLPEFSGPPESAITFGGDGDSISDDDCVRAARSIKIVHEPAPTDKAFVLAREAISAAHRVLFLGFAYSAQNVERLQLADCMQKNARVFACTFGYTPAQCQEVIRPLFNTWGPSMVFGSENQDIVQFFRANPGALL